MFGQLVVSKTAVLPAFYRLSISFLQPFYKPPLSEVLLEKDHIAEPVF